MSDSGQKFIKRNRAPRVHISYEDPYNAEKLIELPFVMGVLADLSGNAPGVAKAEVADRKFLDIDMDNFDKRMSAIQPASAALGLDSTQYILGDVLLSKVYLGLDFSANTLGLALIA